MVRHDFDCINFVVYDLIWDEYNETFSILCKNENRKITIVFYDVINGVSAEEIRRKKLFAIRSDSDGKFEITTEDPVISERVILTVYAKKYAIKEK